MRKYSVREIFTQNITKLLIYCHLRGYGVTQGEGHRTKEQQAIHVKTGASKVKISQHQKRLGHDYHIWGAVDGSKYISDKAWRKVGEYWESLSPKNRWGGRYGVKPSDYNTEMGWDKWHFESRN